MSERSGEQLACQDVVELVTDYLEGALDPDRTAQFREHLQICPHCVEYLEQVRRTIRTLGQVPPEALPPETMDGLLAAFGDLRPRRP